MKKETGKFIQKHLDLAQMGIKHLKKTDINAPEARVLASGIRDSIKKACSKMSKSTYGDLVEKIEIMEKGFSRSFRDADIPTIKGFIKQIDAHIISTKKHISELQDKLEKEPNI